LVVGLLDEPDLPLAVDRRFRTWRGARLHLLAYLLRHTGDECRDCARWAAAQLPSVVGLKPGSDWSGDLDGNTIELRGATVEPYTCPRCGRDGVLRRDGDRVFLPGCCFDLI
jgi:hypothetical protein